MHSTPLQFLPCANCSPRERAESCLSYNFSATSDNSLLFARSLRPRNSVVVANAGSIMEVSRHHHHHNLLYVPRASSFSRKSWCCYCLIPRRPETTAIARRVRCLRGAVRNVTARAGRRRQGHHLGRPRRIWERTARLIVRTATSNLLTSHAMCNQYAPNVSMRTVQRVLIDAADLEQRKMRAAPR